MWDIRPLIGVGPLACGMGMDDVARAIGAPVRRLPEWDGSMAEHRGPGAPTCTFQDERLAAIGFDKMVGGVALDGVDGLRSIPPLPFATSSTAMGARRDLASTFSSSTGSQ